MALSILHRMTGVALTVGTLLLVYWLMAAAMGPDAYAQAQALLGWWVGRLLLFGWSFALFYHLCNGLRHLAWDAGRGFALGNAQASGILVVLVSLGLTVLAWVAGYAVMGG